MDVERKLISFCIHNRTIAEALEENITSTLFSERYAKVWDWMLRFYKEHGEAPGEEAFDAKFDDFDLSRPSESLSYWCERVRERYIFAKVQESMTDAAMSLSKQTPRDAVEALRKAIALTDAQASKKPDSKWSESVDSRLARYNRLKSAGGIEGLPFPFPSLTKVTGGLQKGDYMMIVAKSGVGKTFFLMLLASHMMRMGHTVFFSSREMPKDQIVQRLDAVMYSLPYDEFRRGDLDTDMERYYFEEMRKLREGEVKFGEFIVNDESHGGVGALRSKIDQHKPSIVIVDGFYLMDDDQGIKSGWEKSQNISQDMKRAALATKVPIVATGQLNDENQIAFFKGLERDLDLLVEMSQTTDERMAKKMNFIGRKQREGSKFLVKTSWDIDSMTFEEPEGQDSSSMEW